MQLSKEVIEEFKEIYKKVFKKEISDQETYERRSRLVNFYKTLWEINCRYRLKQKYYQQLISIFLNIIKKQKRVVVTIIFL